MTHIPTFVIHIARDLATDKAKEAASRRSLERLVRDATCFANSANGCSGNLGARLFDARAVLAGRPVPGVETAAAAEQALLGALREDGWRDPASAPSSTSGDAGKGGCDAD